VEIKRPATTETVAIWRAFYAAYQYSNLNYLIHFKKIDDKNVPKSSN